MMGFGDTHGYVGYIAGFFLHDIEKPYQNSCFIKAAKLRCYYTSSLREP